MTTQVATRVLIQAAVTPTGLRAPVVTRLQTAKGRPAWLQVLGDLAGVVGITLLVPLAVVALPLSLAWRAILEAKWRLNLGASGRR